MNKDLDHNYKIKETILVNGEKSYSILKKKLIQTPFISSIPYWDFYENAPSLASARARLHILLGKAVKQTNYYYD